MANLMSNSRPSRKRAARFQADASSGAGGRPWFTISNSAERPACEICIYQQIGKDWWSGEGVDAKAFCDELKKVPMDRPIQLRINSPGGNVHDGITIYNRLAERRAHVEVVVDGVAASIASVIACCGSKLVMPKNALLMVHDPWAYVQGDAADLRHAAEMLDKHRDAICTVYQDKTGMTPDECKAAMAAETWYTAQDAEDAGFADEVAEREIEFQACFNFAYARNTPQVLVQAGREQPTEDQNMNRSRIEAALKKLGVIYDASMTTEQLKQLLDTKRAEALARGRPAATAAVAAAPAAGQPEGSVEDDAEPAAVAAAIAQAAAPPAAAQPGGARVISYAEFQAVQATLNQMSANYESERRRRVESAVDTCVVEDRITLDQRDRWVTRALDDETVLADLQNMPQRPPGAQPVGAVITGESPLDISRGVLALRAPLASHLRGNSIDMKVLGLNAMAINREITKHRDKLLSILNANTVDADLKRNVILNDMMRAFKRNLIRLQVFSTLYSNVPLLGTNKIVVPFWELDTAASKDYVAEDGYVFDQDTAVSKREVTVNRRKYKPMEFSSDEFRRQPYFNPPMSLLLKAEQLAVDVWLDVLGVVTQGNFGNPVLNAEPGTFDVDDVIQVDKRCNDADWPELGRALVLGTSHKAALLADENLKYAMYAGTDQALRAGATGRIINFDMVYSPRIPTNGEDLAGFAVLPPAIIVATSPIAPAPGVRSQLLSYDLVSDAETGMSFEYRYWGEPRVDKDREIVECNFGRNVGNEAALKRITAGANVNSSSSSLSSSSSVNSSSSSSS